MNIAAKEVDYTTLRFLVADDKAFIRSIVQGMLLRLRAKEVLHAANGVQAQRLLRKYGYRIDCIISDWNMDPVGGLELLQRVRSGAITGLPRETCFVMLTGHSKETVVKSAVALDVSGYLVKPVSFEKLVKTVGTALERELRLKAAEHYEAVEGTEVPATIKASDAHVPPWVVWIAKSPRRAQLEERIQQIRRDAADAKRNDDADKAIEIKNMRRMPMEEIPPGLLLAEDVYGNDRALLIAAGTVLSNNLLSRLRELASDSGEQVKLWVGDG